MKTFRIQSREYRLLGAQGISRQNLDVYIEAEDEANAIKRVYQTYDHIHGMTVTEVGAPLPLPQRMNAE